MSAFGLTEREQEVTRLVLKGEPSRPDRRRARRIPHTVQEHLKNIFEKTGVRSRRDLVSKVFFSDAQAPVAAFVVRPELKPKAKPPGSVLGQHPRSGTDINDAQAIPGTAPDAPRWRPPGRRIE